MTLVLAAAETGPAQAGNVAGYVAGGLAASAGTGGAVVSWRANRVRSREASIASERLLLRDDPEIVYMSMVRGAEWRSNVTSIACLITLVLGALTIIAGAAMGFLFGMADVGIFTAVCGGLPSAISGLLLKASATANQDAKEARIELAASREKDLDVERTIRMHKEVDSRRAGKLYVSKVRVRSPDQLILEKRRQGPAEDINRAHPWNAAAAPTETEEGQDAWDELASKPTPSARGVAGGQQMKRGYSVKASRPRRVASALADQWEDDRR